MSSTVQQTMPSLSSATITTNSNGGVALAGTYSNIDTDSIVTSLMNIESATQTLTKTQQTTIQSQQTALQAIQTQVQTIDTLLATMSDASNLSSFDVSSSDPYAVSATAASGADAGSHTIVVNQLASADRWVQTAGLASSTASLGPANSFAVSAQGVASADDTYFTTSDNGATYSFSLGGETAISVSFDADTSYTLNQVVSAINAASQAASGYNAASIQTDSQNNAHLELSAQNSNSGLLSVTNVSGDDIASLDDSSSNWTKTDAGKWTGMFSYSYDGKSTSVAVSSSTTLSGLASLINSDSNNPGVTASVMQYNGTSHLVLAGKQTGSANTITVNDASTTISGFDQAGFTQTQAAQNAQVQIDGYPTGTNWMEESTNTISDAIAGVTITLQSATPTDSSGNPEPAELTISQDTSTIATDLSTLVSDYNTLYTTVHSYIDYDSTNQKGGLLQGNATVTELLDQIRDCLTNPAGGFLQGTDSFTMPPDLGITVSDAGQLSLDTSTLNDALSKDYQGVINLISAQGKGTSSSTFVQLSGSASTTTPGSYDVSVDYDASGNITAARIRQTGATTWDAATVNGTVINAATGTPEAGLVLNAVADSSQTGAYTQTATIRLQQGFAVADYNVTEALLAPTTGALALQNTDFQNQIDALTQTISDQQTELDAKKAQLQTEFANMETVLSQIAGMQGQYLALINGLNNNNNS